MGEDYDYVEITSELADQLAAADSHIDDLHDQLRAAESVKQGLLNSAIADACMKAEAAAVHCYEMRDDFVDELLSKEYPTTRGDFLRFAPVQRYPRIVMNPPFTGNQDVEHVTHALKFLEPGGILVAIMAPNQRRKGFVDLNIEFEPDIEELDRGLFKESGTDIATLMVTIEI